MNWIRGFSSGIGRSIWSTDRESVVARNEASTNPPRLRAISRSLCVMGSASELHTAAQHRAQVTAYIATSTTVCWSFRPTKGGFGDFTTNFAENRSCSAKPTMGPLLLCAIGRGRAEVPCSDRRDDAGSIQRAHAAARSSQPCQGSRVPRVKVAPPTRTNVRHYGRDEVAGWRLPAGRSGTESGYSDSGVCVAASWRACALSMILSSTRRAAGGISYVSSG